MFDVDEHALRSPSSDSWGKGGGVGGGGEGGRGGEGRGAGEADGSHCLRRSRLGRQDRPIGSCGWPTPLGVGPEAAAEGL